MLERRGTHLTGATVVTAIVLAVAGCGGDDGDAPQGGDAPSAAEPASITVQETAGVPSAFVAFGIDKGYFRECGLDVELEAAQGGAATVPGLINGDVDVGGSNVVSLLLAQEKGLPLRVIAPGTSAQTEGEEDFAALIVSGDSKIRSPQDLEGRTVAVNTLDNIAEVVVKRSLEEQDVDVDKVRLTEVPFPEMNSALEGGDIDAAFQIEPFLTRALGRGAEVINYSYVVTKPNLQVGSYAVTTKFAEQRPEVVRCFQQAVAKNADYITAHEDEFRTFLSERAEMEPELAEKIRLPRFTRSVDVASLELLAELMARYGVSEAAPDASELVGESAAG